jgi:DNA repair and recombination protein RAD52
MSFNDIQVAALRAKLDASHVKERSQAGRSLSYIEGWHAIAEANRIFGFDAWDRETIDLRQLGAVYDNAKGNKVVNYMARVRIIVRAGNAVIVRDGCGFGSGIDRDEGQAHESALKEAETDAMKRALMTFGNPFGLALYDKKQENVVTADRKAQEGLAVVMLTAIDKCATSQELQDWWKQHWPEIKDLPEDLRSGLIAGKDERKGRLAGKAA